MKKRRQEIEVVDDEELNALGRYFDEHQEETEAELERAKVQGRVYTLDGLGCSDAFEAGRKILSMRAAKKPKTELKTYSFRLPVFVISELKKKAKARRVPYQRFVNEVLTRVATM